MAVTETRIQIRISNLNSRDLFACKWLRAPATMNDEGLATSAPLTPLVYPDFTRELPSAAAINLSPRSTTVAG